MKDGLRSEERKRKIIEFLVVHKSSTREDLAREFRVSKRTITRDIVDLSPIVPIFTKSGNQGGIYILPNYRTNREYLTLTEENCLHELSNEVCHDRKVILQGIVKRFSMPHK